MKKIILISVICFYACLTQAQVVTVPDSSLSTYLKRTYPAVFNPSGQLIISEAAKISGTLNLSNKGIRSAEGVQYFVNVTNLQLQNNFLDTLPDLGKITKLTYLNVIYNQLRHLPGIGKLTALETLYAWKNEITELPDLSALQNLTDLHVFNNALTSVPVLGSKPRLKTVYLNDNFIRRITDFSSCPQLRNVRLYNNPLTFKEILKLTVVPGYDTLFKLNPRQPLQTGFRVSIRQNDPLLLTTGIDRGVPGVTYRWFKNNTEIATSEFDSLVIGKTSLKDSGNYFCQLSHAAFPSVKITTDLYRVQVSNCLDLDQIRISAREITCMSTGSISVFPGNQPVQSFELRSPASGKTFVSHTGVFNGLSEQVYQLTLLAENGCLTSYPFAVNLIRKECEEVLLSPDGDGNGDSYFFEDTGKVIIYDKRGNIVKTLSIPGEWNGTAEKEKVSSGFYVADVNNGTRLIGITILY